VLPPGCGRRQAYLPTADVVLLIHTASISPEHVASALQPWLESSVHTKLLCDVRADADALQYVYGIRLAGASDVQLAHAMVTGELRSIGLTPGDSPFFFPTGLSRLTYEYCGEQVGEPLAQLKSQFSSLFDAGDAPFRTLPLSPAAATYAASDAWHVWLVHQALLPRIEAAGLGPLLSRASDNRAAEFRDVPGGRKLWEARLRQAKRERSANKASRPTGSPSTEQRGARALHEKDEGCRNKCERQSRVGKKRQRDAAADRASGTLPPKRRVVSGPACACCGIRFSGQAQLEEHRRGKHHSMVAAVVDQPTRVCLRVSADVQLDEDKLRATLGPYGEIRKVRVTAPFTATGLNGEWRAVVEFGSNAEVGRVLGQKLLFVDGCKLRTVALPEEQPAELHDMVGK